MNNKHLLKKSHNRKISINISSIQSPDHKAIYKIEKIENFDGNLNNSRVKEINQLKANLRNNLEQKDTLKKKGNNKSSHLIDDSINGRNAMNINNNNLLNSTNISNIYSRKDLAFEEKISPKKTNLNQRFKNLIPNSPGNNNLLSKNLLKGKLNISGNAPNFINLNEEKQNLVNRPENMKIIIKNREND